MGGATALRRLAAEYRDVVRSSAGSRDGRTAGPLPSPSRDDSIEIILFPKVRVVWTYADTEVSHVWLPLPAY